MACAEVRDGVAVRAGVRYHVPGKTMLPEVCTPYTVRTRKIAQDQTLQAQPDIYFIPAFPRRRCNCSNSAVPDLPPGGIWIEIRKAHTEHSFDVSSMGFFAASCASVVHQFGSKFKPAEKSTGLVCIIDRSWLRFPRPSRSHTAGMRAHRGTSPARCAGGR